jgi:hypothetical protein
MSSATRRAALTAGIAALSLAVMGGVAVAGDTVSGHLLRSGEQTGFRVSGRPLFAPTVAAAIRDLHMTGKPAKAYARVLTRAGFRGGSQEQLAGRSGAQGFALVAALASASGPANVRNYLITVAYDDNSGGHSRLTRFRVPGVPSARGLTAFAGTVATSNVYWTEGRCVLGSGLYLPDAAQLTPAAVNAPVIAGVRSQRARTHGHCS